jgi:hypothetical protein
VIIKSFNFILNKLSNALNKPVVQSLILFLSVISAYLYYDVSSNHNCCLDRFALYTISYVFSS